MINGELFKIALPKGYTRRMTNAGITPSMYHELGVQGQSMFRKALDDIYIATSDGMAIEAAMRQQSREHAS